MKFRRPDLKTAIGRIRRFPDRESIRGLIERTPTKLSSEDLQALNNGLETSRGALWLELTAEHLAKLKR